MATQTYDLNASRTRFLLDGLASGTEYVVFMLFVSNNRVPALYPCVRCFTTPTSGTCLINPCLKVEKVNGSPSCEAVFDGCNLVLPNTSGSNCFGRNPAPVYPAIPASLSPVLLTRHPP